MRTSLSPGGESSRAVGVLLCAWGRFAGCSWQGAHALASPACWSMMLSPSPNPHPGSFLLLPSPLCPWNTLFSLQGFVPGAPLIPPALFLAPHTHLTASSLWAFLSAVSSPLRPHGPTSPLTNSSSTNLNLAQGLVSSKEPSLTTSRLCVPLLWASLSHATSEMTTVHFPRRPPRLTHPAQAPPRHFHLGAPRSEADAEQLLG